MALLGNASLAEAVGWAIKHCPVRCSMKDRNVVHRSAIHKECVCGCGMGNDTRL